jgi:branched-chain amino acid transport system substrate-binding protein
MRSPLPVVLSLFLGTALHAEIRLGAVYSTSGEFAPIGLPSLNGAKTVVREINASGGINGEKVTLIILPTPSSAKVAAQEVAESLVKDPTIDAIFGLGDTDLALAAARAASTKGKVFVTSGATSPRLPAQAGPLCFLACFGDNAQAAVAAEWLAKTRQAKSAAIIHNNSKTYTRLLQSYFASAFTHHGGNILVDVPYAQGTIPPIPASVLKADAVYLAAESAGEAKPIIRALRSLGYKGPIVGGDGYDSTDAWITSHLAHDVWFTTHAFPARSKGAASQTKTAAFCTDYTVATGIQANSFAGLGRDTALLLAQAVGKSHAGKKTLATVLNETQDFPGVTGAISYKDDSRIPVKPVAVVSAHDPLTQAVQIIPTWVPKP